MLVFVLQCCYSGPKLHKYQKTCLIHNYCDFRIKVNNAGINTTTLFCYQGGFFFLEMEHCASIPATDGCLLLMSQTAGVERALHVSWAALSAALAA